MARTVPQRWINAVIVFTIPLDVSLDSSPAEQQDAVLDLFEERFPDPGDDCVATMRPEVAEG